MWNKLKYKKYIVQKAKNQAKNLKVEYKWILFFFNVDNLKVEYKCILISF